MNVFFFFFFSVPSRAPNGVRVTSFDFKSDLLVEWDPLSQNYTNGKLLGYTIYFKEYNYYWSPNKSVDTSAHYPTRFMLKGLKPAHKYFVAVAAFTSKGVGPLSDFEYNITGTLLKKNSYYLGDTNPALAPFPESDALRGRKRASIGVG